MKLQKMKLYNSCGNRSIANSNLDADLSTFLLIFSWILPPGVVFESSEALLTHTLFKFYYLIH